MRISREAAGWLRALCTACVLAGSSAAALAQTQAPLERPFTRVQDGFGTDTWNADRGNWAMQGSVYSATVANPIAISTLNQYFVAPHGSPSAVQRLDRYVFGVRMLNPSASADTSVGLVFNYLDESNYHEVVFTPARDVQIRRVTGGLATVLRSTAYEEGGQHRWFDVELVRRSNAYLTLIVNGNVLVADLWSGAAPGRLGVVAHGTQGQFTNVSIERPVGTLPFKETFADGSAQGWPNLDRNHWTIAGGVLKNFTVQRDNKAYLPARTSAAYWDPVLGSVRAKMRSPYSASGNRVGLFWGDDGAGNYREVVFSRTGVARIHQVRADGTLTVLATAAIPVLPNDWFEVTLQVGFDTTVLLNGEPVFDALPLDLPTGRFGLIAHWTPGQFDDVEFQEHPFPRPYREPFAVAAMDVVALSGIWITSGEVLTSAGLGEGDVTIFVSAPSLNHAYLPRASVDFSWRARLLNTTADGAVGLLTHYDYGSQQFYEVLFAADGRIVVNKHVQGTVVQQAQGTHGIAPNTWFEVELRCAGNKTAVHVNGVEVLNGIPQGQVRHGYVGVVTRATRAQFDEVEWREIK